MSLPRYRDPDFFQLLTSSYQRLLGVPLVDPALPQAEAMHWLYEQAPFCVLSHNTAASPVFVYANRTAQRCFGYSWDAFTQLESRLSAEAPNREERDRLLQAVQRDGYASGYRGLRIAADGRRFWIENVTVWNLLDDAGVYHGQAATYRSWQDA
ncbi:MEKHLA domain-containing protein [Vogesella sp. LIG4]|uniref:MEKHLA domain-containing protein n=1 Tax=Vogesella sp. LIG4 TaxID=1192162 RepID=UPI0008201A04|nr:MEKHLA domain-containing protein [Vogesella sp. LIG4]SCK25638.1 PAS domain S-box-containing protein [Vogesella sp. LIG4]